MDSSASCGSNERGKSCVCCVQLCIVTHFSHLHARRQKPEPPKKLPPLLKVWWDYDVLSPAAVLAPKLNEVTPPPFVTPDGWLRHVCNIVRDEFSRWDTESTRVSPVALVRCSRGGKTRALHELAWALREENDTDAIIYVSFNGFTSLSEWEYEQPLEALCRRILFAALGDKDTTDFREFNDYTTANKRDVKDWLGSKACILLIDELNLVEDSMNAAFATFLKENFLEPAGRAFVFSSHVMSVRKTLTDYMHSPSEREVKIVKLPVVENLEQAKILLECPTLTPQLALYLGLLPSLFYESKLNQLPYQRRESAILKYIDSEEFTHEGIEDLLTSTLTGDYALVPKVFREFLDVEVSDQNPVVRWIPHHLSPILLTLSQLGKVPIATRICLKAICEQFDNFRNHKTQSGDGWEALFIITLLTRCLTKRFSELVPLYGFDWEVSWNEPFDGQVNFATEDVEKFVAGIPESRPQKSIAVYFPSYSEFEGYDVILAYWGDNGQRVLIGYQLKRGSKTSKAYARQDVFHRSYLIRGLASSKDSVMRGWTMPSDAVIDQFFGESLRYWSPKRWAALETSANWASADNGAASSS
jgi:hypothetical protein